MVQFSALTMAALSVGALAAVGGGVSYAAKDAEPGDLLYPVHTSLYGNVSADAEAELSAAQDVFDQALTLRAEGKLDSDVHADLTDDINVHVQAVHGLIADLESEGNTEAAEEVRASLRTRLHDFETLFMIRAESGTSASSDSSQESSDSDASSSFMDDDSSADTDSSVDAEVNADSSAGLEADDDAIDAGLNVDADGSVIID